jgi:carboxypeptidase family protein
MITRRWLAIAGLACALLGAWGAVAFLRETREGEAGDATSDRANAAASAARAHGDAAGEGDGSSDDSKSRDLAASVVSFDPRLEWPDVAALRRIEQHGRALFGGIVYAPDGKPCAGASIFCNRDAIATSDDHGAWRADVSRPVDFDLDGGLETVPQRDPPFLLAAHKAGIGFAEAEVDAVSRRVDLHLRGGFSFRGTVIDNDDLRPVGGAELEARVRSIVERVRADGRGDFAFPGLPSGTLELSGRAPGHDSNGAFPFNFERGRDVEITFRLSKAFRLRGQFAPWPAPAVASKSATVVAAPRSPHAGASAPVLTVAVGDDGSFDVSLPVCPACHVELVAETGTLWQSDLDVNEERHDVDLGRIELTAMAALTGRVAVPDASVSSALEISAHASGLAALVRPVAADGSFRLLSLRAGRVYANVSLDDGWIASLRDASGLSEAERYEAEVELAPGEMRDVGVITPARRLVVGTVRDGRGEPVALAQLWLVTEEGPRARRFPSNEWSDEEGHFHLEFDDASEPSRRIVLEVHARGFAPTRTEVELREGVTWNRCDLVFPDGVVLRGTLLDEKGAPVSAASIRAEPAGVAGAAGDRADDRAACSATQADGSFEIRGLDAGEWKLYAVPRGRPTVRFTKIHPDQGPMTLRMVDGEPVTMPSLPR